jgi:hypothetical protein
MPADMLRTLQGYDPDIAKNREQLPGTISGSCWALVEPGPGTIKLRRTPRLYWERRGNLADPISGAAVLEYGARQRYCRRLARS